MLVLEEEGFMRILSAILVCGTLAGAPLIGADLAAASDKVVIGPVEEVLLLPGNIRLTARVDTGAGTSSLDAQDIRVRGPRGAHIVRFTLVGDTGSTVHELPMLQRHSVRTSDSRPERRPVVQMELCLAAQRVSAEITLNDRSHMEYRMLLGRNVLAGRFVVDVDRTVITPAACPPRP
jgi:hypothetical protein